jgi:3-isopropylmalate dehydrogenase
MQLLLIPGDGIGPEVMSQGKKLLGAISRHYQLEMALTEVDWGANRWLRDGVGIPANERVHIASADAILFGALGDPRIPDMAHGREILLGLRQGLDLFINLRPIRLLNDTLGVLKNRAADEIDMVIFRENTQDIYLGLGGSHRRGHKDEVAIDESLHTYAGVERIIHAAFSYAVEHGRKKVTLVDKANAIRHGGLLWQRVFHEVKSQFPGVAADHLHVDVAAMVMVQDPARLDVIVTSNLFGDILSDLGAGLTGGLGLASSANINPGVKALFEPVHGSAPDIAGQNLANPFAMFLSIGLMMQYLGHKGAADHILRAVIESIRLKKTTPDLGGGLGTEEVACEFLDNFVRGVVV